MKNWIALAFLTMGASVTFMALGQAPKIQFTAWQKPERPRLKDVDRGIQFLWAEMKGQKRPKLTKRWRKDRTFRILLLSLCWGEESAKVIYGQGQGYGEAFADLADQLREKSILRKATWIKLDIIRDLGPPQLARHGRDFKLDYSFEGLANADGTWALLPGELVAREVYLKEQINGDALASALRAGGRNHPSVSQEFRFPGLSLRRFKTWGYFSDGGKTLPLYRDHRMHDSPSLATLESSMAAGMDYLTRVTQPSGEFIYVALTKRNPQYSIPRHGGTLFSMAEYYLEYPNPQLLDAILKAQEYLQSKMVLFTAAEPQVPVLVERSFIKMTSMALAVLAMIECYKIHGDPEVLRLAQEMSQFLVSAQLPSGRFYGIRNFGDGRWRKEMEAVYAPGEAIYALAKLYAIDNNPLWLETAEKGADYLIAEGSKIPLERLEHDHWLLYGLNELHKFKPKESYVSHSMTLTHAIDQLQRKQHEQKDWVGTYYTPPRSTPTATRSEGLLAAYRLAMRAKRPKDAKRIWDIAGRSIAFQLQNQYAPENAMHFPYPNETLGGFRGGYLDNRIRIDFVQHNVAAMLVMAQMMKQGKAP